MKRIENVIAIAIIAGIGTGFAEGMTVEKPVQAVLAQEVVKEPVEVVDIREVRLEVIKKPEFKPEGLAVVEVTPPKPVDVETRIRQVFHEEPNTAVAVAKCESGLKMVQARATLSYGREQSFGIFQIHAKDHHQTAVKLGLGDYKENVESNLAMARHLYDRRGNWNDWMCYTRGLYKQYL